MGAPFLPVRGILGSAYLAVNPRFRVMADPFSGEELVAVQALTPDVTLIHGARGDDRGNLLIPRVSDWRLAVTASAKVIATVEERVAGPLTDQPDWRLIPAIHLTALVHCPGGAAPTGYPGYYPQDEAHISSYLESSRDAAAFARYLQDQVWNREG
jgi:glutaconate CoA-transferase subunit A